MPATSDTDRPNLNTHLTIINLIITVWVSRGAECKHGLKTGKRHADNFRGPLTSTQMPSIQSQRLFLWRPSRPDVAEPTGRTSRRVRETVDTCYCRQVLPVRQTFLRISFLTFFSHSHYLVHLHSKSRPVVLRTQCPFAVTCYTYQNPIYCELYSTQFPHFAISAWILFHNLTTVYSFL
jgi:hypothetical protein